MRNLLYGESVQLTSIKEKDYETIETWFNDVNFLRHYDMLPAIPQTFIEVKKSIDVFTEDKNSFVFGIRRIDADVLIGIIGLFDIQWTNGVGTFFIGIGDNNSSGKGYGIEALKLMLDFGFNELNLHRIQLNVISYNDRAIKLYEKVGFKKEGVFRELIYRDNKRYNLYLYGYLRNEWYDKYPINTL